MKRIFLLRLLAFLALLLLMASGPLVFAAPIARAGGLTVEVLPTAIQPQLGESSPLVVILRNSGQVATHVTLSWLNETKASVKFDMAPQATSLRVGRLADGAEYPCQLKVSTPPGFVPGKVFFRVDYRVAGNRHVTTAPLDVQSAVPTNLDDIVAVEVKTTLESLDQQNAGWVYLMVTNKSVMPITVAKVDFKGPSFVHLHESPKRPVTIEPRQTQALQVVLKADERVRPGKNLLLFIIDLQWGDKAQPQKASVITTHQTQIGVFGESAILTLVGVPALLFLPGVLMLIPWSVWRRSRHREQPGYLPLNTVESSVLAITLSILVALIYPLVTHVDYVSEAYGWHDLRWLWIASLVLGVGLAVLIELPPWGRIFRWPPRRP